MAIRPEADWRAMMVSTMEYIVMGANFESRSKQVKEL